MAEERFLIVNADDFGQSAGVNRGIMEAHERGIVTSASLMVRFAASTEAAEYAGSHPELGLGLHVDLGEWAFQGGTWKPRYEIVDLEDFGAIQAEVARQMDVFRRMTGRLPTHVDSHQHVHCREPCRTAILVLADRFGLPVRHFTASVRHCGDFYGQRRDGSPLADGISVERLQRILVRLTPGFTELGCHPGLGTDLDSTYREEREFEVAVLRNPLIREAVDRLGIRLCTYADIEIKSLP